MAGSSCSFRAEPGLIGLITEELTLPPGVMPFFGDLIDLRPPAPNEPRQLQLSNNADVYTTFDAIDEEWIRQHLWGHTFGSGRRDVFGIPTAHQKIYAKRSKWVKGKGNSAIYLHREILEKAIGPPPSPKHIGDHLDGDSLNNRRRNLRWATLSQNAKNLFGSAWLELRDQMNFGYN